MLTGNFLHVETDKEHQKPIVELYNTWQDHIKFLSSIDDSNQQWIDLLEYCKENKEDAKELFIDLVDWVGTSGHFLRMMLILFPEVLQIVNGYLPPKIAEDNLYLGLSGTMPIRVEKDDIMIGDWFELKYPKKYKYVQITAITNMDTLFVKPSKYDEAEEINLYEVKPIELTKEILLKNEWAYNDEYDSYETTQHFGPKMHLKGTKHAYFYYAYEQIPIMYVHELQHLLHVARCPIDTNVN